jgi:hypothetical protein
LGKHPDCKPTRKDRRETTAWLIKGLAWLLLGVLLALVAIWWSWNTGPGLFWPFVGLLVAGISLHRSTKAFVEHWRSRISERVEIEVAAEKDTYLPGDTVNVSVRVTGKEDLDIQEGQVTLVCANRYVYRYTTTDSDGDHVTRTSEVTAEVVAGNERILEEGTIRSGSYTGRDLVFKVPLTAPPSASGEITNVEWKVRVTLLIRGAPDVIEELPLRVLSSSESYRNWAEIAPELASHGVCEMEFRLPSRSLRIGERIEGSLLLTPHEDFEARSLRVELVRREIVPRASGNSTETVEASEVVDESPRYQRGLSREYAFAMEVPGAAGPSLKTEQTYVGWWAQGCGRPGAGFRLRTQAAAQRLQRPGDHGRALPRVRRGDPARIERLCQLRRGSLPGGRTRVEPTRCAAWDVAHRRGAHGLRNPLGPARLRAAPGPALRARQDA